MSTRSMETRGAFEVKAKGGGKLREAGRMRSGFAKAFDLAHQRRMWGLVINRWPTIKARTRAGNGSLPNTDGRPKISAEKLSRDPRSRMCEDEGEEKGGRNTCVVHRMFGGS